MINLEKAKMDPGSVFRSPHDIVKEETLTREEKIDLLRRWAYDEREMAVAEEENMLSSQVEPSNRLTEILKSLLELGVRSDQKDSPPPTKQG